MTDYAPPPGDPGSFDDALEAMEAMAAKKAEFAAIESRLARLGGQLSTPEEYRQWVQLVYRMGSHPRRVCSHLRANIRDHQVYQGADHAWRAPQ
jgi:hypothetical protein